MNQTRSPGQDDPPWNQAGHGTPTRPGVDRRRRSNRRERIAATTR
ncbi:hypothetical protein FOQG_19379 [Fusarium oxysporum f. sp. raphani 54005]|uniref:Uncharacterized protein n=1 Tax=Fusarium oxysporum f. sp. raphani 54005 TaxID=1089458 RepID=X0BZ90_FUSOX|nr:hypothetical protein FOQG_19379 [Fusarium oxysporum f. sp. raphani 54005]